MIGRFAAAWVRLFAIFAVLLASVPASAAPVWTQNPANPPAGGIPSQWWYDPTGQNNLDSDASAYDNFTLSQDTTITQVEWWGSDPPGPGPVGFTVQFYNQDAGTVALQPDLTQFHGHPPLSSQNSTVYTQTSVGGGMYHFTMSLPTPVALAANTVANPRYWFCVYHNTPLAYYTWNWAQGYGGDSKTFYYQYAGSPAGGPYYTLRGTDRAFILRDATGLDATTVAVPPVTAGLAHTVNLTATLTRTSGGSAIAGATLDFTVDAGAIGSAVTDASGVATLAYDVPESLGEGAHTIAASFAGDGSSAASSGSSTLTATRSDTAITVGSVSGAIGATVTLTCHLFSDIPVPGRYVDFAIDGSSVGGAYTDIDGNGVLDYVLPDTLTEGVHDITVTFDGSIDAAFNSSFTTSPALTVSLGATDLVLDPAFGDRGSIVALQAHLTSSGSAVVGRTVAFTVDGVSAGSAATDAAGLAAVSYTIAAAAAAGAHTVDAVFDATGDTAYTGSTAAPGTLTVRTPTAFSLYAVSGAPGAAVTLKALMMGGGAPVVGRTVAFSVDGSAAGTGVTDAAGVASCAYTIPLAMTVGAHNVTVAFDGSADIKYASATRTTAVLTVALPKANVGFSLYAASGSPGDRVTLRSLMQSGGAAVIGRLVKFSVDGTLVGTGTSDAAGVSLAWTIPAGFAVGTHNVGVSFAGDASYNAASRTSAVLTALAPRANVGFSPYAASGAPGAVVTLCTLMLSGGAAVTGRTVQFAVDGVSVGSAASGASGASRSWTIPVAMALGTHNLTVSFAGDTAYNAAARTVACITVVVPKANVAFSPYAVSGAAGQAVQLRAVVMSGGAAAVGLTIDVAVDGAAVGSAVSDASGVSRAYTIPAGAAPGLHNVTFSFAGDATHNAASRTSASLTVK